MQFTIYTLCVCYFVIYLIFLFLRSLGGDKDLPEQQPERKLRVRKCFGSEIFPKSPDTATDRWSTLTSDWYAYTGLEHYPCRLLRSKYDTALHLRSDKKGAKGGRSLIRHSVWTRRVIEKNSTADAEWDR